MRTAQPPRWMERLTEWALPEGLSSQGALGDMAEEFERRASTSAVAAWFWYLVQSMSIVGYRVFARGGESVLSSSDVVTDFRWSLRTMLKHPGFSFGVVAVLGLGLGANTAVFSVVDGTLENTSWWDDPEATVAVWPGQAFSFGQLGLYDDEQSVYRVLGGYTELAFALRGADGESESVNGVTITPALFRELAVQPTRGRALSDDDEVLGAERVVVVSESLWRRSLDADPDIVGKTVDVSGVSMTVVGVQGAGGAAPGGRADLWMPNLIDPREDDYWRAQESTVVGVLREGATLDDAFTDLVAYTDRLSELFPMFFPDGFAEGIATVARADATQRRMVATPLLLLLGGTALLMFVTALNVGNLLLGRAIDRRRELAVRGALGAARSRIVRQLLVEGLVLTALALGIGLWVAALGSQWLAGLFVGEVVVANSSVFSPNVLGFALAVAGLAWLVLNGVPIAYYLRSQRAGLHAAPASGARVQRVLVSVQAALATLLLVSASLLVGTVDNLRGVPLGFDSSRLLTVELSPPEDRVATATDARDLYGRLSERLSGIAGVQSVGLTGWLPLRVDAPPTPVNLEAAPVPVANAQRVAMQKVDPGFFDAFDVTPHAGRLLGSDERGDVPSAIVVNQTLADLLWPQGNAVGQRIAIDPHAWDEWAPVVGVVPDIRSGEITQPIGPALYVALAESPARDVTIVVRTSIDPTQTVAAVRTAVAEVDPLVPIRIVSSMDDVVRAAYSTSWVMMGLLVVLAILATSLGAIGVYAVLAHYVALNKKEIGVRMALGAQPRTLVTMLIRSGLRLAGIGIAVGIVAAGATSRFLESLLFGVTSLSPVAYVVAALGLAAAAILAAWIPALRASRLPPADVLRSDS